MTHDPLDTLIDDAATSYRLPPHAPREEMWQRIHAARRDRLAPPIASSRQYRWLRNATGIAAVLLAGVVIGRVTRSPSGVATGSVTTTRPHGSPADSALGIVRQSGASDEQPSADPSASGTGGAEITGDNHVAPRLTAGAQSARASDRSSYDGARSTPDAVSDGSGMNAYRLAVVEHLARTEVLLTGFRAQSRGEHVDARTAGQQFAVLSRELLRNTRMLLSTHATDDPTLTRLLEDLELVLMQISQYAEEGRSGDLDAINQSPDRRNVLPKLRSTIPAGAPVPPAT